jgi:hypothetical protein
MHQKVDKAKRDSAVAQVEFISGLEGEFTAKIAPIMDRLRAQKAAMGARYPEAGFLRPETRAQMLQDMRVRRAGWPRCRGALWGVTQQLRRLGAREARAAKAGEARCGIRLTCRPDYLSPVPCPPTQVLCEFWRRMQHTHKTGLIDDAWWLANRNWAGRAKEYRLLGAPLAAGLWVPLPRARAAGHARHAAREAYRRAPLPH